MLPSSATDINTSAWEINNNGLVVGQVTYSSPSTGFTVEGFTYQSGVYTLLSPAWRAKRGFVVSAVY